jgi:WD40 repeat protein
MDTKILKPLYSFSLQDTALTSEWLPSKFAENVSGKYLLHGLASGELVLGHFNDDGSEVQMTTIETGHMLGIQVLCWGPDYLATGSQDGLICLWEPKIESRVLSLSKTFTIKTASSWISDLVWFSVQGMSLLASASGKVVQLWNPLDGSLVHSFDPVTSTVTSLAFSKGMRSLLATCYGQVHLYDFKDLSKLEKASYHVYEEKGSFLKVCAFPGKHLV